MSPFMPVIAHVGAGTSDPRTWAELARAWEPDPFVLLLLAASAWLYRRGARVWRAGAPRGGGLRPWEAACFWTGWWTLALALASPLHPWGRVLFSAHMTQHELLMVAAAPLLVLGRPVSAYLLAIPRGEARVLSRAARRPRLRALWRFCTEPFVAWAVHAAALWLWHVPALFQATLRHELVHDLQHASFFGTALLFWWSLLRPGAAGRQLGAAVLYVFTTMLHSGLLGALILFSDRLIYPDYAATAPAWGLSGLEDQQLGGLIMWVPAGLVYVVAALAIVAASLRDAGRRPPAHRPRPALDAVVSLCLVALFLSGCDQPARQQSADTPAANPAAGRRTVKLLGCGTCHHIPGVPGADGRVGPSLAGVGSRQFIGGVLPNTPENMVRWLLDPSTHAPGTLMPGVVPDEEDALDIAAYLSTLRGSP